MQSKSIDIDKETIEDDLQDQFPFPIANCRFCKKEFEKTMHNKLYCNAECRKANQILLNNSRFTNK